MSALFLLNLFRLFGITEMFCRFVGRKQITVWCLAKWLCVLALSVGKPFCQTPVIGSLFNQIKNLTTMIKVTVEGKTRVIRDKHIHYQTENDLECTYKDHRICIAKQEAANDYYVTVTDKTGMYAVQGGFGGNYCRYGIETIEDCLVMCIKNILI